MRFEHDGMSLWYGTADAPAPEGAIQTGSDITITIGVQPTYASNKVDMLYRVNQGSVETIAAKWLRHDLSGKAQYFRARFPVLHVGDTVEYTAVCHCAGRQVPSHSEARQLASSFHVVAVGLAESEPRASSVLKETPMSKTDSMNGSNTSTISPARTVSPPTAVPPEPSPGPTKDQPLPSYEAQKTALKSLLSTTPVMVDARLQDTFINLYAQHQGPIQDFWSKLRDQLEFKTPGTVENIQFTLQLGVLTQNNLPLIQALQGLCQQGNLQSIRDLTRLDANVWTNLVNTPGNSTSILSTVAGATQEEKVANYVSSIVDSLRRAFPTSYIAQEVAKQPGIDLKLVKSVIAQNPSLNLHNPLAGNLKMVAISTADQEKAKSSIEALRQEVRMFPGLDATTLLSTNNTLGFQNPMRQALTQFFANAPDFDFRDTHIDTYIAEHGEAALKGIDARVKDVFPDQLKRMQRVFRVTSKPQAMNVLLGAGLHSAHAIASIPQSTFIKQFQDGLDGETQAQMVYAQAKHINALAMNTFVQVHQHLNDVSPRVIGSVDQATIDAFKQIPDWPTLFDSLDFCDCEQCRSVYSPAAYFVDMLQFLNPKVPPAVGSKPIDALFERRPDLKYIKLTCENTNTTLPYVDLVNEILETYVAADYTKETVDGQTLVKNTSPDDTSEGLSANPAYTNNDAYEALKKAFYPFALPYNQPLDVVRAYLEHLGGSRYEVMKAFQKNNAPTDQQIAYEYLKISPEEYSILTSVDLKPEFYGYPSDTQISSLITSLASVPELLQRTGISYLDLLEILKTRYLNPNRFAAPDKALALDIPADADPCDLSKTSVKNLDEATLQKLHRFIRLWRKPGWSMQDLDRVIEALGATDLDDPFFQKLAQVKQLQTDLNVPLVQLLSLWNNIETYRYETDRDDSLYATLFLNKALLNPPDGAFTSSLPPAPPQIVGDGKSELKISKHIPAILAALHLSTTDFTALVATEVTDDALTLENLSKLYRYTVLARALKLSIKDLIALKTLTGKEPFQKDPSQPGSPTDTIEFLDIFRKVRQSSFSLSQLNYLFRHLYDPNSGIAPLQNSVGLLFKGLQDGLQKIANDTIVDADPTGDLLRRKLSIIFDSALVDATMKLIDGSATYTSPLPSMPTITFPDSIKDKITYDIIKKILQYTGNMTQDEKTLLLALSEDANYQAAINDLFQQPRTFIAKNLAGFLKPADAIATLLDDATQTNEQKITYVLTPLMTYLRLSLSQSLIKQTLSDALKLDTATTELLLESVIKAHTDLTQYAMVDFLALADTSLPSLDLPLKSYYLLYKVALLIITFKMNAKEVAYLSTHGDQFGNFDFNGLPLERSDPPTLTGEFAVTLMKQWEQLYDFFTLRDSLPQGEVDLIDVFGATTLDDAKNKLILATNWDTTMLGDLSGPDGFGLTIDDLKNVSILLNLQTSLALMRRLGASAGQLFAWAGNEADATQAQEIKNSVKARYDNEQWLTVAKSLNDGLRENQRTALIAYLLQIQQIKDAGINDSSQLYEYFLIDVDMDACMLTSRIVQANATVQLFVQRCLMNLEPEVSPAAIDADTWQWMKRYRTWEANRKVFLYPENWIEPELRDNKSPFFKELETELLQNEITLDTAEQAFLNYLEKLDQVARLEICGMYWQEDPITDADQRDWRNVYVPKPQTNILHIFGRTFTIPHIYYYRQLLVNTMAWTPWEKVNVDIEGDHLVPVVYNRRLYIFWPIFTDKQNTPTTTGTSPQLPPKFLEIKLAWSEYKQNKWSTKQVSLDSEALHDYNDDPPVDRSLYTFKALVEDQQLKVSVYENTFGNPRLGLVSCMIGSFVFKDCRGRIAIDNTVNADVCLMDLDEGDYYFMTLREPDTSTQFTLTYGEFVDKQNPTADEIQHLPIFERTPSRYDLLYPHQYSQFAAQAPFFYQDDERTYFVSPEDIRFGIHSFQPNSIIPPLIRTTVVSAITTNNASGAGNPPIFDHAAWSIVKESPMAVSTRTALAPVGITAVAQSITDEPSRTMTHPPVVSGSVVSAGTALPDTVRKDLIIHPFGGLQPQPSTRFYSFYHSHVCDFIKLLNQGGIPNLLTLDTQRLTNDVQGKGIITRFEIEYSPNSTIVVGQNSEYVDTPYPLESVDFEYSGAYSLYNWELFFHIPMLMATKLSKNQRFAEAQQWYHYIFNPTDSSTDSAPQRYWKVLCFQSTVSERLQDLLKQVDDPSSSIHAQIQEWRDNPFNPHLIARMRLIAYQKNVVMKYIDNLIAWGDQLFQQDTMESINEATQLYILASEILGPRPEQIPEQGTVEPIAYADVQWDSFANALVSLENHIQASSNVPPLSTNGSGNGSLSGSSLGSTFYFCIPNNDTLWGYWDTVADRIFKIRHCMNFEGVVRQLPLFAPPIDVSLLVQAAAMGVDLSSVLNDINAATPHYRFTYMLQKALEFCNDVKALGASLLAVLEKKDAEALAMLRASQETSLLKAVRDVKQQQLDEANRNKEALQKTLDVTTYRLNHYQQLTVNQLNEHETIQLNALKSANDQQGTVADHEMAAQFMNMLPNFSVGANVGAPTATAATFSISFGGSNMGSAAFAYSRFLGIQVAQDTYASNSNGIIASFARREEEWNFQIGLAVKEILQVNKQIDAATIRASIAQTELDNHDKQIENAQAVEDFLRGKYTNQDLYDWMVGQISAIYFQCYKMAYDIAKRAEQAFRFERGLTTSNYITFGYWDSLKKGLLSGERLYLDLKRLEMAYIDQNKREYEITKHISLVLFDPMALIALKETGTCLVNLPEALFDMDYPGHYMRRIKSVALTIPCVAGPYTSINCTLTLLSNRIRKNTNLASGQTDPYTGPKDDDDAVARFITNFGAIESIATSTAQNDSGMFEVNFRDERYLPFEGAGVVSTWRIDMPQDSNAFDFETISDVIIRLNYTAREGGDSLRGKAKDARSQALANADTPQSRLFSAKHEFSSDWYRLLHPADPAKGQQMTLDLTQGRFPFQYRGMDITINRLMLFLILKDGALYNEGQPLTFRLMHGSTEIAKDPDPQKAKAFTTIGSPFENIPFVSIAMSEVVNMDTWSLAEVVDAHPDIINDLWIVCQYSISDKKKTH